MGCHKCIVSWVVNTDQVLFLLSEPRVSSAVLRVVFLKFKTDCIGYFCFSVRGLAYTLYKLLIQIIQKNTVFIIDQQPNSP